MTKLIEINGGKSPSGSKPMRLLDAGSGIGHAANVFALFGNFNVVGVEVNPDFVKTSNQYAGAFVNAMIGSYLSQVGKCKQVVFPPLKHSVRFLKHNLDEGYDEEGGQKGDLGSAEVLFAFLYGCSEKTAMSLAARFNNDPYCKFLVCSKFSKSLNAKKVGFDVELCGALENSCAFKGSTATRQIYFYKKINYEEPTKEYNKLNPKKQSLIWKKFMQIQQAKFSQENHHDLAKKAFFNHVN